MLLEALTRALRAISIIEENEKEKGPPVVEDRRDLSWHAAPPYFTALLLLLMTPREVGRSLVVVGVSD